MTAANQKITRKMLEDAWGTKYAMDYFCEILNGDYAIEKAREDVLSLLEPTNAE